MSQVGTRGKILSRAVQDQGAMSIFMAFVMLGLCVLIFVMNGLAQLWLFEVRVQDAVYSQNDAILAAYDRELLDRYGLFAFEKSKAQSSISAQQLETVTFASPAQISCEAKRPLFEPETFKKALIRFMRPRFPVRLAKHLWQRIRGAMEQKSELIPSAKTAAKDSVYFASTWWPEDSSENAKQLDSALSLSPLTPEPVAALRFSVVTQPITSGTMLGRYVYSHPFESNKHVQKATLLAASNSLQGTGKNELFDYLRKSILYEKRQDKLKEAQQSKDDDQESESENQGKERDEEKKSEDKQEKLSAFLSLEGKRESLDESAAEVFGQETLKRWTRAENVLDEAQDLYRQVTSAPVPVLDQLLINEYILGMCSSQVRNQDKRVPSSNGLSSNYTWRMKTYNQQKYASDCEIEEILTGMKPGLAKMMIKGSIFCLRLPGHALAVRGEPVRMGAYRATGILISALGAIFSIPIPVEAVVSMQVFIEASRRSIQDLRQLLAGESIPLYGAKNKIQVDYHDFLRIFLILLPERMKLERLARCIQKNTKTDFYTAVDSSASWHWYGVERQVKHEDRYDDASAVEAELQEHSGERTRGPLFSPEDFDARAAIQARFTGGRVAGTVRFGHA